MDYHLESAPSQNEEFPSLMCIALPRKINQLCQVQAAHLWGTDKLRAPCHQHSTDEQNNRISHKKYASCCTGATELTSLTQEPEDESGETLLPV